MKLSGPACTEALNEAEIANTRKRTPGNAGGVRLEREVRQASMYEMSTAQIRLFSRVKGHSRDSFKLIDGKRDQRD